MLREEHGEITQKKEEKARQQSEGSTNFEGSIKERGVSEGGWKGAEGKDRGRVLEAKGRNNIKERMGHSIKIFKDKQSKDFIVHDNQVVIYNSCQKGSTGIGVGEANKPCY